MIPWNRVVYSEITLVRVPDDRSFGIEGGGHGQGRHGNGRIQVRVLAVDQKAQALLDGGPADALETLQSPLQVDFFGRREAVDVAQGAARQIRGPLLHGGSQLSRIGGVALADLHLKEVSPLRTPDLMESKKPNCPQI